MIKIDMEMPGVCSDCKYYISMFDGDEGIHYVCLIESKEVYVDLYRPDWCPLIECEQVERTSTDVVGVKDNKFSKIHKDDVIIADTINGKRYLRVVYGSPLQEFDFDGCWCGWDLQNEEVTPLFQLQGTPLIVGNIDDKEIYDKWENGDVER